MSLARFFPASLLLSSLLTLGCHAQQPAPASSPAAPAGPSAGTPLPPDVARKVEVMLREKANLPPETSVAVGGVSPSEFPGYDKLSVTVTNDGKTSKPIPFLLSTDRKTLAQITKFDITADPKALVSPGERPARGGPVGAPVTIVEFDDLECPYCARLHNSLFPAITDRYGKSVRIVYRDWPEDQHPWALHAAVDTNCLANQSPDGYWAEVDYIHAHAGSFGADPKDPKAEKTLPRAAEQLDTLTHEQGAFRKVDLAKLDSCVKAQDAGPVNVSRKMGDDLNLTATPTLFINGDKIEGAVSLSFLFGIIDQALRVEGVTPPPPYIAPASAAPAGASPATPAGQ